MSMREELAVALSAIKSDDLFSAAKARAMVTVYDELWRENWRSYQIVDVECILSAS